MPGEGTRANVNAPLWLEALVTGAADAAVRPRAPTAAAVATPAAAQVTARRRRCLTMCMNAPLFRWRRHRGAASVGQGYAAPGSPGSPGAEIFPLNPRAVPRVSPTDGRRPGWSDAMRGAVRSRTADDAIVTEM